MNVTRTLIRWIAPSLFAVVLTAGVATAAQMTSSSAADFKMLLFGDRRIAQALYEAQVSGATSGTNTRLTLDEIAAMKLRGEGWGEIFQQMKTEGRLEEKNLGQVVSEFASRHRVSLSPPRASLGADERMQIAGDEERAQGSASFEGGSRDKGLRLDSQTSFGAGGVRGDLGARSGLGLGGGRRR